MPYARVLDDDETQFADEAAIGAACRLAIPLIEADAADTLLADGESSMTITYDRLGGAAYRTTAPDGTPTTGSPSPTASKPSSRPPSPTP